VWWLEGRFLLPISSRQIIDESISNFYCRFLPAKLTIIELDTMKNDNRRWQLAMGNDNGIQIQIYPNPPLML
jgi:hypothetical protein